MKKRLLLSLILVVFAILGCSFSLSPKITTVYAAEPVSIDSFYLENGATQYKANVAVGSASGYGNYKLGDENISLTATAKDGYKIVGWRIVLKDQNNKVEFIKSSKTIASLSKQFIELQGTLTFDSEEQFTAYDGEDVTLYTNATDGINTYAELYKDSSNKYYIVNSRDVAINVVFEDVNEDGCNDEGLLEITKVFENITIEPVFDFIYYQVEITDFVNKIKLPSVLVENFNGYKIYGLTNGEEGNYLKTINTIIKNANDKYFYVGDAYVDLTNQKAFAKHTTLQVTPSVQYVDMFAENGAFRLGQTVNTEFKVDIVDNIADKTKNLAQIQNSVNIDVVGVKVNANAIKSFVKTTDAYNRTSNIAVQFNIKQTQSLINEIVLDYHNLYVVDLNRTINNKTASQVQYTVKQFEDVEINGVTYSDLYLRDGEYYITKNGVRVPVEVPADAVLGEATDLTINDIDKFFTISNTNEAAFIKVSYHYAAISDLIYLVKSAEDNSGYAFEVNCSASYSEVSLGDRYYYYNFDKLDGDNNTKKSFADVDSNKSININYLPTTYNVEFKTAVVKDEKIEIVELENNIDAISLIAGESKTITDSATNVGYEFKGYAFNKNEDASSLPSSVLVKVNNINPSKQLVYIVYNYKNYSLSILNLTSINLNGTYPLSSLTLDVNRDGNTTSNDLTISDLTRFENLNIGDTLSFNYAVNNGFTFNKFMLYTKYNYTLESWTTEKFNLYYYDEQNFVYKLNTSQTYNNETTYYIAKEEISTLDLDKNLISSLVNDNIIIVADVNYVYYALTYYIQPVEGVIMAEIWATKGASTEKITGVENDENGNYEIVFENLKLGDIINLHSKGKTFTDANSQTKQYAFNWFTVNGRDQLSNSDDEEIYTHTEAVFTSRAIYVVYSLPITQVFVKVNNDLAYSLFEGEDNEDTENIDERTYNIVATADGIALTPLVDNLGNLSFKCSVDNEIVITLLLGKIKIGYVLDGFTIENNKLTSENKTNLYCGFTAVDGNQILHINFKAIEYRFVVEQNGAGLTNQQYTEGFIYNDEAGTINDYYYTVLTVENRTINLTKPEGYYIGEVAVNIKTNLYPAMNQTNDSKTDANIMLYSYTFTEEEFITFVGTNGDLTNNLQVITLKVVYSVYTYDISVAYKLTNGTKGLDYITLPRIDFYYNNSATGQNIKVEPYFNNNTKTLLCENIPYGTLTSLMVVSHPSVGIQKLGWFEKNGDILSENDIYLITKISSDFDFEYKLKYIEYTILLNYDKNANEGNPTILVNEVANTIAVLGDKIEISANAYRNEGYTFDCMMLKYVYTTEQNWLNDCLNLYVSTGSGYTLNTIEEYNPSETYYVKNTNSKFIINDFNVIEYVVETNTSGKPIINFYIYYAMLEVKIINYSTEINSKQSITNSKNPLKDMHIAYEDYANYTVQATDVVTGVTRTVSANGVVTKDDKITITIQINENAQNRKIKTDEDGYFITDADGNYVFEYVNEFYNLVNGLTLYSVSKLTDLADYGYDETDKSTGCYRITFSMINVIRANAKLDENDNLNISYSYSVQQKSVSVTTNVTDSSFYSKNRMEITDTYTSKTKYSKDKETIISQEAQFLSKAKLVCYLTEIKQYFKVIDIVVYKDGVEVKEENYSTYGVQKIYYTATEMQEQQVKGLKNVNLRVITDIKIEFIVQPILYFEGVEVESEDYTFYREYSCDNEANGNKINLTPQQGTISKNVDITIPTIISTSNVIITYTHTEDGVLKQVDPEDVGTYNVNISFASVTGNYSWLNNISVPVKVSLEITPKTLYVTYNAESISEYLVKEYDGQNSVGGVFYGTSGEEIKEYKNNNDLLKYLILTDNKGVKIKYADIINYELFNDNICLSTNEIIASITKTAINEETGAEIQETAKNASEFLYNITLTNILLDSLKDFNRNFELYVVEGETAASLTINNIIKITPRLLTLNLSKIDVEDKVEDGNADASFSNDTEFILQNIVSGDIVSIASSKVNAMFSDITVGNNKTVTIDPTNALEGLNIGNYYIEISTIENKTIYPYSVKYEMPEVGTFVLYNERGLTDPTKVNLIPLDAELQISVIQQGTGEFADLFKYFEKYLTNTKEFSVGYSLTLQVYGVKQNISNELYLSIPNGENEIVNVINLSGEETVNVNYSTENNNIVVDLSNINLNIDKFVLLQKKALLKLWQIVLIVAGCVVIVGGAVTAIVIIRIRRNRKNELLEKI